MKNIAKAVCGMALVVIGLLLASVIITGFFREAGELSRQLRQINQTDNRY